MERSDTQHKLLHQSLLGPGIYLWIRICLLFRIHASQNNQHLTSNGFWIRRLWRWNPLLFFQWFQLIKQIWWMDWTMDHLKAFAAQYQPDDVHTPWVENHTKFRSLRSESLMGLRLLRLTTRTHLSSSWHWGTVSSLPLSHIIRTKPYSKLSDSTMIG